MAKSGPKIKKQPLSKSQVNITGEVEYIINKAVNRDSRVVSLDQLIFF